MTEQPNGHFGDTIVKLFLFSSFNFLFYNKLSQSKNENFSAFAFKSLKEVKYHLKHSKSWIVRLGDGTKESNKKVQESLNSLWEFTGEFFEMDEIDNELNKKGIGVNNKSLKEDWNNIINTTLLESKLKRPEDGYMQTGSKNGLHTEHLGHILSEIQYLKHTPMQNGNTEKIWELLNTVPDPEIPVISVVELGVIRNVEYVNKTYLISITPTYSGCPAVKTFQDDIKICLSKNGIDNFDIKLVYSPAWTTDWMSDSTKKKLLKYGISPPSNKIICPQCKSTSTSLVSEFGQLQLVQVFS